MNSVELEMRPKRGSERLHISAFGLVVILWLPLVPECRCVRSSLMRVSQMLGVESLPGMGSAACLDLYVRPSNAGLPYEGATRTHYKFE